MPIEITVELDGLDDLEKSLKRVKGRGWATSAMGAWAVKTARGLSRKAYPSAPPNSSYTRTGRLGRQWSGAKTGEMEVTISNNAAHQGKYYARFVVSDRQAAVHRGRWWQAHEVIVREHMPKLLDEFDDKLSEIWDQ